MSRIWLGSAIGCHENAGWISINNQTFSKAAGTYFHFPTFKLGVRDEWAQKIIDVATWLEGKIVAWEILGCHITMGGIASKLGWEQSGGLPAQRTVSQGVPKLGRVGFFTNKHGVRSNTPKWHKIAENCIKLQCL